MPSLNQFRLTSVSLGHHAGEDELKMLQPEEDPCLNSGEEETQSLPKDATYDGGGEKMFKTELN